MFQKQNLFKLSLLQVSAICIVVLFTSGAGYVGELPKLDSYSGASQVDIQKSEPVLPLAPRKFPAVYTGAIINQGRYSQYLKDLDELIPILENMKQYIEDKNANIQMFCAKASMINLYVNNLKVKYDNKTERNYESFKQLIILNKKLSETTEYWRYTSKYNKLIRGSLEDREKDQEIMNQKLSMALKAINTTLEILKENSTD